MAEQASKQESLSRAVNAAHRRAGQPPLSAQTNANTENRRGAVDAGREGLDFEVLRTVTLSAFVFTSTASQSQPNPRLTQWIDDYSKLPPFFFYF